MKWKERKEKLTAHRHKKHVKLKAQKREKEGARERESTWNDQANQRIIGIIYTQLPIDAVNLLCVWSVFSFFFTSVVVVVVVVFASSWNSITFIAANVNVLA